jgi:cobalt-zinc-cadmium efflux system outer membrane protein
MYDWKALVATVGLQQLPLSEVAGRVDRFIPYYDYDAALAHVVRNHSDILTARNGVMRAQYVLKLAQVTPVIPDLDVRATLEKDFALAPFGTYHALSVGFPIPIWDQNKGNIIAAQASLVRASEEAHRVEVTLTSNLAAAYTNYKNNLVALEDYRRTILPDLVRYYRGIFTRRQIDPNSAFGDLVNAQQILSTNVTAYIAVLGNLWSSVVGVADFLQTDDLYQLAEVRELPELPDINLMSLVICGHPALAEACTRGAGTAGHGAGPGAAAAPIGGISIPHILNAPAVPTTGAGPANAPADRPQVAGASPSRSKPGGDEVESGTIRGSPLLPRTSAVAAQEVDRAGSPMPPPGPSPFTAGLDRRGDAQIPPARRTSGSRNRETDRDRTLVPHDELDAGPAATAAVGGDTSWRGL